MQKLKTCAFLAILSLLLLTACEDSGTERWVQLGEDKFGRSFYIDRASVQKTSDSYATAWVRRGNPPNTRSYRIDLLEFDFSYRTYRQLVSSYYAKNIRDGAPYDYELRDKDDTPSEWYYIQPESIVDAAYLNIKRWLKM